MPTKCPRLSWHVAPDCVHRGTPHGYMQSHLEVFMRDFTGKSVSKSNLTNPVKVGCRVEIWKISEYRLGYLLHALPEISTETLSKYIPSSIFSYGTQCVAVRSNMAYLYSPSTSSHDLTIAPLITKLYGRKSKCSQEHSRPSKIRLRTKWKSLKRIMVECLQVAPVISDVGWSDVGMALRNIRGT